MRIVILVILSVASAAPPPSLRGRAAPQSSWIRLYAPRRLFGPQIRSQEAACCACAFYTKNEEHAGEKMVCFAGLCSADRDEPKKDYGTDDHCWDTVPEKYLEKHKSLQQGPADGPNGAGSSLVMDKTWGQRCRTNAMACASFKGAGPPEPAGAKWDAVDAGDDDTHDNMTVKQHADDTRWHDYEEKDGRWQ